jgi:hypothetical protein
MEVEDQIQWKKFREEVGNKLTKEQYKLLCRLHAKLYNHRYHEPCSCSPAKLVQWIKDINIIYEKLI